MSQTQEDRNWDGHDWSGEEHPAREAQGPQWDERSWAGEAPHTAGTDHGADGAGPSGRGHGSGEQHWAPDRR